MEKILAKIDKQDLLEALFDQLNQKQTNQTTTAEKPKTKNSTSSKPKPDSPTPIATLGGETTKRTATAKAPIYGSIDTTGYRINMKDPRGRMINKAGKKLDNTNKKCREEWAEYCKNSPAMAKREKQGEDKPKEPERKLGRKGGIMRADVSWKVSKEIDGLNFALNRKEVEKAELAAENTKLRKVCDQFGEVLEYFQIKLNIQSKGKPALFYKINSDGSKVKDKVVRRSDQINLDTLITIFEKKMLSSSYKRKRVASESDESEKVIQTDKIAKKDAETIEIAKNDVGQADATETAKNTLDNQTAKNAEKDEKTPTNIVKTTACSQNF